MQVAKVNARVLVVEDERIIGLDEKNMLEGMGYTVVDLVGTSQAALRRARMLQPDIVLMDIRLEHEDAGIEAAGQIREDLNIPVVFATANADMDTLERAKTAGAYGYVVKPFRAPQLRTAIEIAVTNHSEDKRIRRQREYFRALAQRTADLVLVLDTGGRVIDASSSVMGVLGLKVEEIVGCGLDTFAHPEDQDDLRSRLAGFDEVNDGMEGSDLLRLRSRTGSWRTVELTTVNALQDRVIGGIVAAIKVVEPLGHKSERKASTSTTPSTPTSLDEPTLSLLPICSSCKKIRDEHGRWEQIEEYLKSRWIATFTHSICPTCADRLYPETPPTET